MGGDSGEGGHSEGYNAESSDSNIESSVETSSNSEIDAEATDDELDLAFEDEQYEKRETGDENSETKETGKENHDKIEDHTEKIEDGTKSEVEDGEISEKDISELPPNVQESYHRYVQDGWNGPHSDATPGTKGGGEFSNRDGDLPTVDNEGKPITYKEYDVNNKPTDGSRRDHERFVIGSDGSVYYSGDLYDSFTKIK